MTDHTRYQRYLICIAASIYLVWWFVVDGLLPNAFNPLPSRLAVCGLYIAVLVGSYRIQVVKANLAHLYTFCSCILTLHYYYLFAHNASDVNWIVGSYITVMAVGISLEGTLPLFIYTSLVIVCSAFIAVSESTTIVGLPGMITVLIQINIVAFLRNKLETEKKRRIVAEADKASAEAINREKMLFLANISHELRTPLTGIIGFTEILSENPDFSGKSKEMLARIDSNSQQLLKTVEQILLLMQDDVSQLHANEVRSTIKSILESELQKAEAECKSKDLSLNILLDNSCEAPILVNATYLRRIVGNILDNAVKFTKSGSIYLSARIESLKIPNLKKLTISIQDSGAGILKEDWEKCFLTFTQLENEFNRSYGGTGLGLTVARILARAMNGDVKIKESETGVGTTIVITIEALSD